MGYFSAHRYGSAIDSHLVRFQYERRKISGKTPLKMGMPQESNQVEQAVSRALRENLERVQRTSDELHQAINDLVAACASTKPANALPPMLRAQAAAASLSATLDVLSRFLTMTLQAGPRPPLGAEMARVVSIPMPAGEPTLPPQRPVAPIPTPMAEEAFSAADSEIVLEEPAEETLSTPAPASAVFDLNRLPLEEQELHRRANRVAKVSMQDIKMLRPEQVRLGRENRDLCRRLRDDLEKAHREYDRRFNAILNHPVDYFYHWLVQILADGDPKALGEYPYAATSKHR